MYTYSTQNSSLLTFVYNDYNWIDSSRKLESVVTIVYAVGVWGNQNGERLYSLIVKTRQKQDK